MKDLNTEKLNESIDSLLLPENYEKIDNVKSKVNDIGLLSPHKVNNIINENIPPINYNNYSFDSDILDNKNNNNLKNEVDEKDALIASFSKDLKELDKLFNKNKDESHESNRKNLYVTFDKEKQGVEENPGGSVENPGGSLNEERNMKGKFDPNKEYADLIDPDYYEELKIIDDIHKRKGNSENKNTEGKLVIKKVDSFNVDNIYDKFVARNFELRKRIGQTHETCTFVSICAWNIQSLNKDYQKRQVKLEFMRDVLNDNKMDFVFLIDVNDKSGIMILNGYTKYTDGRNILFVKASIHNEFTISNYCFYDEVSKLAFVYVTPNCGDDVLVNNVKYLLINDYMVVGDINCKSNYKLQPYVKNFIGEDSIQTGFASNKGKAVLKYNAIAAPSDHALIYGHVKVKINISFPMRLMQISEQITYNYINDICNGKVPDIKPKIKPIQGFINLNDRERVINSMLDDYLNNALASIYKRYRYIYFTGSKEPFLGNKVNENIVKTFAEHLHDNKDKVYRNVPKVTESKVFDDNLAIWGSKSHATTFDFMQLDSIASCLRKFIRKNNARDITEEISFYEGEEIIEFFSIDKVMNNVTEVATKLKEAAICETFFLVKNKKLMDYNDVRMIVIIPGFVKVYEFLIYNIVSRFFFQYFNDKKKARYQFGALKKGSTYSAMLNLRLICSERKAKSIVFLDIAKGFDCVDIGILENCIDRYISDQHVKEALKIWVIMVHNLDLSMNNIRIKRCRGVPMGLTLSPLMFEFYVDCALEVCDKSLITSFVDDTAVVQVESRTLSENINELNKVRDSLNAFKLVVNERKSGFISKDPDYINELGKTFKLVEEEKYLGRVIMINGDGQLVVDNRFFNKKAFRTKAYPYWANYFTKKLIFNGAIISKFAYKTYMFSSIDKSIRTSMWRNSWYFFKSNMGKFSYFQVAFSIINFFRFCIDTYDYKCWKERLLNGESRVSINNEVIRKLTVDIPQIADAINGIIPRWDVSDNDIFMQTKAFNDFLFNQFKANMVNKYIKDKRREYVEFYPKVAKFMNSRFFSHFGFLQNIVLLHIDNKRRYKQIALWLLMKAIAVEVDSKLTAWKDKNSLVATWSWDKVFAKVDAEDIDLESVTNLNEWEWEYVMVRKYREIWNLIDDLLFIYTNAKYKKNKSKENDGQDYDEDKPENHKILKDRPSLFVDGSYNAVNNKIGYGGFLKEVDGSVIANFSDWEYDDPETTFELKNIYGELRATVMGLELAKSHQIRKINLCYDYIGIQKYAQFEWASANAFINEYVSNMRKLGAVMEINFVKVYSHSGHEDNDKADMIAKNACGIRKSKWIKKVQVSEDEIFFFKNLYKNIFKVLVVIDVLWMNNALNGLNPNQFIWNAKLKIINMDSFSEKLYKCVVTDEIDENYSEFNDLLIA